jgi:hypothetical protein
MKIRSDMAVRGAALLLGLLLSLGAVIAWRVPPGTGRLGADVVFSSGPIGELDVGPTGPFLSATSLHPGSESHAPSSELDVQNITGVPLGVRMRGLPSGDDLDGLLWVRIDAGASRVFRGPLEDLRPWTAPMTLASGEDRTLTVRTWLPDDEDDGYMGRIEQVSLEFAADRLSA